MLIVSWVEWGEVKVGGGSRGRRSGRVGLEVEVEGGGEGGWNRIPGGKAVYEGLRAEHMDPILKRRNRLAT